jgi:PhnB protein
MKVETYINFPGNCEEALHFYEQHLGAKILMLMRQGEQPGGEVMPGMEGKVMHARLRIGDTDVLMSDGPAGKTEPMRSVYLTMKLNSIEEAEWFNGLLGDQGQIYMPMQETFFAHRFSVLRDRFGVSWMILFEREMHPEG